MRRNLAIVSMLVLLAGGVHVELRRFYLDVVNRDGIAERTQQQYDAVRESVRTLIVGDSHAKWGILAGDLEDAFNLSLPAQTTPETYYVLASEVERPEIDLDWAVISADALAFSGWQAGERVYLHWYAPRVDYLAIGWQRRELLFYGARQLVGRHAPYMGGRAQILNYLETGTPPHPPFLQTEKLARGSFYGPRSWTRHKPASRNERAKGRVKIHFPEPEFDEVAGRYLRRSLEFCRERGIRVMVVRFPMSLEYARASRAFARDARVDERLAEIFGDHPEAIVVDARRDYLNRPKLFGDPDHLNASGARLFTARLRAIMQAVGS